jgi:hypothetical protein
MNGWRGWTTEEWSALGALVAAGGAVGTLVVAIVAGLRRPRDAEGRGQDRPAVTPRAGTRPASRARPAQSVRHWPVGPVAADAILTWDQDLLR